MTDPELQFLDVGSGDEARKIAFRRRPAQRRDRPGLIWLCGFKSDMGSTKAAALDAHAEAGGLGLLRFDYSGHGASGGAFEDGTISRWLEETLAVIRAASDGPQILVGSSMGGYVALLAARALGHAGEAARLAGMALIAPAVDFTEALMWAKATKHQRRAIAEEGVWRRHSPYSPEPYPITRGLIEDGRKHLLMGTTIRSHCPIRILQGMRDEDVPYAHVMMLVEHIPADPVTLTLIKDGDHRLSRPEDTALLMAAIDGLSTPPGRLV